MKKVYIVTVYNSLNAGSFLQAYSLYQTIEKLGYEVSFLDAGVRNLKKDTMISVLRLIKKGDLKSAIRKIHMGREFQNELKKYQITKLTKEVTEDPNAYFVLGSDEIWNVARKEMADFPIFWGIGLPLDRCISYAPSLNNATEENLKKYDYVQESLSHLKSISVRDHYSHQCLSIITDREIVEVCDPTLLLDREDYHKITAPVGLEDYILVYMYPGAIEQKKIQAIIDFAKEKKMQTVCFGSYMSWCDQFVSGSPFDFLSYMKGATYVCTTTFHGTMFAAIFQKQCAILGNKNRKVKELMEVLSLDRHADETNLASVLDKPFDYESNNVSVERLKNTGLSYLKEKLDS